MNEDANMITLGMSYKAHTSALTCPESVAEAVPAGWEGGHRAGRCAPSPRRMSSPPAGPATSCRPCSRTRSAGGGRSDVWAVRGPHVDSVAVPGLQGEGGQRCGRSGGLMSIV